MRIEIDLRSVNVFFSFTTLFSVALIFGSSILLAIPQKLKRTCLVVALLALAIQLCFFLLYPVPMMIHFQGEFFDCFVMFLRRSTEARPNRNLITALWFIKILALIQ